MHYRYLFSRWEYVEVVYAQNNPSPSFKILIGIKNGICIEHTKIVMLSWFQSLLSFQSSYEEIVFFDNYDLACKEAKRLLEENHKEYDKRTRLKKARETAFPTKRFT